MKWIILSNHFVIHFVDLRNSYWLMIIYTISWIVKLMVNKIITRILIIATFWKEYGKCKQPFCWWKIIIPVQYLVWPSTKILKVTEIWAKWYSRLCHISTFYHTRYNTYNNELHKSENNLTVVTLYIQYSL